MKLAWSKSDEPKPPQARDTKRNCGQLLGRLDELLPCLYIAQYGASGRAMRERTADAAAGLFVVGARTGGDRPGVAPRVGLLLPLSLCRDGRRARHCWKFLSHPWLATADSASGPRSRETEAP